VKRKLGILVPVLAVLALVISAFAFAAPAMAEEPPGANTNAIGIGIGYDTDIVYYYGGTIDYIVTIFVPAATTTIKPAQQTDIDVWIMPPDGVEVYLGTIDELNPGEDYSFPPYPYVIDPADVTEVLAMEVVVTSARCAGTAQLNPTRPSSAQAEVATNVFHEELTVEKTATAYFTRTHLWDIDKEVTTEYGRTIGEEETPKIWLVQNGTGDETATWNVCVTYLGYEDDWFNIFGMIIIENTGTTDAVITSVEDYLCGDLIDIEWPVGTVFPYTLPVGESLVGIYGEYVDEAVQDCINEVTVTTQRAQYYASADVIWGEPYVEYYDVVNIEDVSNGLFPTQYFGPLYAADYNEGDVVCFQYGMFFAWTDYTAEGPYTYDNTAEIVETGQSASARLIVNWTREELCWGDDTAWAYGEDFANPNWDYVNNMFWGWTNGPLGEGHYMWPIYAGAGQNILDNGYVVGTLYVDYYDGCVTVKYEMDPGYYMGETHLWVGDDVLPEVKRGRSTVYTNAPGQFPYGTHKDPTFTFNPEDPSGTGLTEWTWSKCGFEGNIYVAAHSVVWMPVDCPEPDPIP